MNEASTGLERPKQTPVSIRLVRTKEGKEHVPEHERLDRPDVFNDNLTRSYSKSLRERVVIGSQSDKNEIWTPERAMLGVLRKIRGFPEEDKRKFMNNFLLDPYVFQRDPSYLYKSLCYAFGPYFGESAYYDFMRYAQT